MDKSKADEILSQLRIKMKDWILSRLEETFPDVPESDLKLFFSPSFHAPLLITITSDVLTVYVKVPPPESAAPIDMRSFLPTAEKEISVSEALVEEWVALLAQEKDYSGDHVMIDGMPGLIWVENEIVYDGNLSGLETSTALFRTIYEIWLNAVTASQESHVIRDGLESIGGYLGSDIGWYALDGKIRFYGGIVGGTAGQLDAVLKKFKETDVIFDFGGVSAVAPIMASFTAQIRREYGDRIINMPVS